ncbi:MAG: hypothetical protein R3195_11630 [Gemmatimonadota bacterium]|nr:hypothetical protein [Gemmatimonadota bacterium]
MSQHATRTATRFAALVSIWLFAGSSTVVSAQTPPGAEVVAPGVVSTAAVEHGAAFSPDGDTMYFTRSTAAWGAGGGRSTILVSRLAGGEWTDPVPAPFSGEHDDSSPFVSPDGRRLFFVSQRSPPAGSGGGGRDVWVYPLDAGPGAEATFVEGGVNTAAHEYSPVSTASGTLYFASTREGGSGQGDLYAARPAPGGFGPAENLGPAVNSPFGEWNLFVAPDESFMVFESSGRALNRTLPGDLYISFREAEWTPAVPAASINTPGSDLLPRVSPDGSTLYWASSYSLTSGHTDILSAPLRPLLDSARVAGRPLLAAVSRSAHHVAIIDPQTLEPVRRIDTGPGPHEVSGLAGGGAVVAEYGNYPNPHEEPVDAHPGFAPDHPSGNTLRWLDAVGGASRAFPIPDCTRSHGVQASADGSRVWATCEDEGAVVEMDVATGRVSARWDTGLPGSHRLIATHDDRYLTVASPQDGSVAVIDRVSGAVTVLEIGAGSEGLARTNAGTVWVLASGSETLTEIDPTGPVILRSFSTGAGFPISVSLDVERGHAWVAHMGPRAVDVLDLRDGSRVARIPFATGPLRVLVVPESRHVYVSLPRENAIAVVDRATREVVGRIEGIMEVDGLDWLRVDPSSRP